MRPEPANQPRQESFQFGIFWRHAGNMYYDILVAAEKNQAAHYFNAHKRLDVTLVEIELIGHEYLTDKEMEEVLRGPSRMLCEWWRQDYGQTSKADVRQNVAQP